MSTNQTSVGLMTALVIVIAVGCTSVEPPSPTAQAIQLKRVYVVTEKGINKIWLPAGTYYPDFSRGKGTYYRAPGHIITEALGIRLMRNGGIYIPNSADSDQRQGYWLDNQEGGMLLFGMYSADKVYRFKETVPYEFLNVGSEESPQNQQGTNMPVFQDLAK